MLVWAGFALPTPGADLERDFAVVVEDGRIVAAGHRMDLEAHYPSAKRWGGESYALLPAFVNSHDHGRGLGTVALGISDEMLEIWLLYLRALQCDPYLAAAYDGARLARSGVGTVVHSHNPRDWRDLDAEAAATIKGYRDVGLRVALHLPIFDEVPLVYHDEQVFLAGLPPDLRKDAKTLTQSPPLLARDYWDLTLDLLHTWNDSVSHRVHIQVGPANAIWCSDDLLRDAATFARAHTTRMHMHLLETRYQAEYARKRWKTTFIKHLDEIGVLGPWLTLAHVVWPDDGDIDLLAERQVAVVVNPSSNIRLGSGIPPIASLMASGAVVGVGLDGLSFDDDQDYLRELRLAWRLANRTAERMPVTAASKVWRAGSRGGAVATFGDTVPLGTLSPGQLADLVLLDVGRTVELFSEEDMLSRAASSGVRYLMVDGQWIVHDGRATRVDEAELLRALWRCLPVDHITRLSELRKRVGALAPAMRGLYAQWDAQMKARG
jgi:cytosine/adenosine deaminase-related metal-dependent hydrolase